MLATKKFKNQEEIAAHYNVWPSTVSMRLDKYRAPKINFAELMPWELSVDDRNQRPARQLRLHIRSKLEYETLSEKEEESHAAWVSSLQAKILTFDDEKGWEYIKRNEGHENFVVVLPDGHELPQETIDLYRMD
ncbi:hypothetical protein AB0B15_17000 [Streptomyces sp. NPDC045456]